MAWSCTRKADELLPKIVFYGELQEEKRFLGGQKKSYEDTLKASLKDFNIKLSPGNKLHRIEQICEAVKDRVKTAKPELKDHHQSPYSQSSHALLATDSLELKLAIKEHTITRDHILLWIKMVFLNSER